MSAELTANNKIAEQIEKMLSSNRMASAILLVGGNAQTREELGMWICEKVLCKDELSKQKFLHQNHEDFITVEKPEDKESIVVPQIEELIEKLSFKPYGESYAVLLKDAHLMREASQNKLLKTLEEPQSPCVMILLTERKDAILQTIQSRCISFVLEETNTKADESVLAMAELFVRLIKQNAPYYKKKTVLSDIFADKDNARQRGLEFLDVLEEKLEKELLLGTDNQAVLSKAIKQAETSRRYLKQVHSVAYTLKQLCLRV